MRIEDSEALKAYKEGKNVYLKVVGKGENQHLKAEKKGFLGRLWIRLRGENSSYSLYKISLYVSKNIGDTSFKINPDDILSLENLRKKVNLYAEKHPDKSKGIKRRDIQLERLVNDLDRIIEDNKELDKTE